MQSKIWWLINGALIIWKFNFPFYVVSCSARSNKHQTLLFQQYVSIEFQQILSLIWSCNYKNDKKFRLCNWILKIYWMCYFSGCPPAFYSPLCTKMCPVNCKGPCDLVTGTCKYGCSSGWIGDTCNIGIINAHLLFLLLCHRIFHILKSFGYMQVKYFFNFIKLTIWKMK